MRKMRRKVVSQTIRVRNKEIAHNKVIMRLKTYNNKMKQHITLIFKGALIFIFPKPISLKINTNSIKVMT
jgi:hypothetical protein